MVKKSQIDGKNTRFILEAIGLNIEKNTKLYPFMILISDK